MAKTDKKQTQPKNPSETPAAEGANPQEQARAQVEDRLLKDLATEELYKLHFEMSMKKESTLKVLQEIDALKNAAAMHIIEREPL